MIYFREHGERFRNGINISKFKGKALVMLEIVFKAGRFSVYVRPSYLKDKKNEENCLYPIRK